MNNPNNQEFNSIAELVSALASGEMIVLCDNADRENEGDLVMAAEKITPEAINFMAGEARGLICLSLTPQKCQELNLPLMVANDDNDAPYGTNFTLSVDAKQGTSTGISAADRAKTIQIAVASNSKPEQLARPGHIFPIMAHPDGVLGRNGHTEAANELVKMAGLTEAAVIVEIMNPDGTMARVPELLKFATKHQLKIGHIADLVSDLTAS